MMMEMGRKTAVRIHEQVQCGISWMERDEEKIKAMRESRW
jgi:hypothetical protein